MKLSERWEEIKGTSGQYYISSHGRCFRLSRFGNFNGGKRFIPEKFILPKTSNKTYFQYRIKIDDFVLRESIHRLVYSHFIGDIEDGMTIHHLDFDPANNHITNLSKCTQRKNLHLSHKNKSKTSGTPCVYFESKKFVGRFYVNSKPIYCGRHKTERGAMMAVHEKSKELLGKSVYEH